MVSLAEALASIAGLPATPWWAAAAPGEARGTVLAEDLHLAADQPPFDRATMDGYAVAPVAGQSTYPVIGTVLAGQAWDAPLTPGQAVRIMTGAPAPAGSAVIPIEATDRGTQTVTIADPALLTVGRNIAKRGEDGRAGSLALRRGTPLNPATEAVAALCGGGPIPLIVPPRVAVVTTGDEVGGTGHAGIINTNGPFLRAFLRALGCDATHHHAADEGGQLRRTLESAFATSEVVVTTGGVSVGDRDLIPQLVGELGLATRFHHVAMQPGKPVLLAADGTRTLIGLPGNPVAVLVSAHVILLPLLRQLAGRRMEGDRLTLPLAIPWQHRGNRLLFLPARRTAQGVTPIRWNGSGDLLAAAAGDCLVELAPGCDLSAGTSVPVVPYVGAVPGDGWAATR